jgi:hypothetical protein
MQVEVQLSHGMLLLSAVGLFDNRPGRLCSFVGHKVAS